MFGFGPLDIIALSWFIIAWAGYSAVIDRRETDSLTRKLAGYRTQWMRQMSNRPMRMIDGQINMHLQQGTGFFASTSLVIIGGCITFMGATDHALDIFASFPFASPPSRMQWEIKVAGLTLIFVYAFFKFGWAYRLFNYCAILIGATPDHEYPDRAYADEMASRAARMNIAAASHFNRGQRAFFFALGYLGWFIHPIALILGTTAVLIVVYRRQFHSDALKALL